jgi:hypothetical protein
MVAMAEGHFQTEIDDIFQPEPIAYSRNLTIAVVNSFYMPNTEVLLVARDLNDRLIAYTWARRETAPWSDDAMALVRMAHVDLALEGRNKVRLVKEMIELWEIWAQSAGLPIVCSTTMRREQEVFLRLHSQAGYDVRGSYAYKRLPSRDSLQS